MRDDRRHITSHATRAPPPRPFRVGAGFHGAMTTG
jgi:hypothetical protein